MSEGYEDLADEAEDILNNLNSGLFKSQANALSNTTTLYTASIAKQETYSENGIPLVVWVADLDDDTCPDCEALDGQTWPVDEAPIPPEHWNCRCEVVPVED